MKIIKSLEALLYELMVWLVFYPKTLWLSTFYPQRMMEYSDDEIDEGDENERYSDTLSPPIFLALSLILAHYLELAVIGELGFSGLLADETNLLAYRVVSFSIFPLIISLRLLRRKNVALDRKTLKQPFYAQCYVAAVFGLGIDLATVVDNLPWDYGLEGMTGAILFAVSWYLLVQARWFARELQTSLWHGLGHALISFVQALFVVALLAAAINSV